MNKSKREVVLVNTNDKPLGLLDIWEAHKTPGVLHRAISVVLFNDQGEMLLQQRSQHKPLWPMFWSNTFCTHPYDGENYIECAVRRGKEELGLKLNAKTLKPLYRFKYQAMYSPELSEHELDTVVIGKYNGEVQVIPEEVSEIKWVSIDWLKDDVIRNPNKYTPWFKLILKDSRFSR